MLGLGHRTLPGQMHEVAVSALAPVLVEFFTTNAAAIGEHDEQESR